ncbi:protein sneaky [Chelonus insularis]|uniref:protein sneaky n=1 Tax=Chelonus insularis TaxID=460826 RepID=UPI00158F4599|nr:protein sneaky [Chelonus insularis]
MPRFERLNYTGLFIVYFQDKLRDFVISKCPYLYDLCFATYGHHNKVRGVGGFFLGFLLALLFYIAIILDLKFDPYTTVTLGGILIIMLSAGCASSRQIRCISLLTIPAFLGRSGRSVLRALVLGYIIAGPILNLTYNGKEVVRTFACTTQLTYNMTKTRLNLMFQPFHEAMLGMKKNVHELKDTVASVRDVISPIVREIEGEEKMRRLHEENDYVDPVTDLKKMKEKNKSNNTKRNIEEDESNLNASSMGEYYEIKYRKKIQAQCIDQLNKGSERCMTMFANAYDQCYDTVSVFAAWILCWPMKLTFLCNVVQAMGGVNVCNPEGNIETGIGEGYASLKEAKGKLESGLKQAKMQYKIKTAPIMIDVRGARDTAKSIIHEFEIRRSIFDTLMVFIKRLLTFVFLKIIFYAQKYHDNYVTDIEFDNQYVTLYFRKIDERRKKLHKTTLLPLKKSEAGKFIDPYGLNLTKAERKNFFGQTIKLALEVFLASTFIIIDDIFFETLHAVRKHGHIDFVQEGHHNLNIDVRGIGVIAKLIRNVITGFNVKKRIKVVISNIACLPQPSKLSNHILIKIYGTYLAIWIMLFLTSYTQRLQHAICSYFYAKREKRRILYLYNETLRRRIGYVRFMKSKVRTLVRERYLERDMDPWVALIMDSPRLCGWLRYFSFARRKCLICGEIEPRKNSKYYTCSTPGCFFIHCPECWQDVENICYACTPLADFSSDSDVDQDFTI